MNNKPFKDWLRKHRRSRYGWVGRYEEVDMACAFKAGIDYQRSLAPKGQTLCNHGMITTVYCHACYLDDLREREMDDET